MMIWHDDELNAAPARTEPQRYRYDLAQLARERVDSQLIFGLSVAGVVVGFLALIFIGRFLS